MESQYYAAPPRQRVVKINFPELCDRPTERDRGQTYVTTYKASGEVGAPKQASEHVACHDHRGTVVQFCTPPPPPPTDQLGEQCSAVRARMLPLFLKSLNEF